MWPPQHPPCAGSFFPLPTPWSADTKDLAVVTGPALGVGNNKAEGAGPPPDRVDPWTGDGDRPRHTSHVSTTLRGFSSTKLRLDRNDRGPSRTSPSPRQGPEGVGADPPLWFLNCAVGQLLKPVAFPRKQGRYRASSEADTECAPQSWWWGALLPHDPAGPRRSSFAAGSRC